MPQGKISFEFCKCRITWDITSKEEKKDVSPLFKEIQNLQFGEFLLVESGIQHILLLSLIHILTLPTIYSV